MAERASEGCTCMSFPRAQTGTCLVYSVSMPGEKVTQALNFKPPGFKSLSYSLLAVLSCISYLTSLSLPFYSPFMKCTYLVSPL